MAFSFYKHFLPLFLLPRMPLALMKWLLIFSCATFCASTRVCVWFGWADCCRDEW